MRKCAITVLVILLSFASQAEEAIPATLLEAQELQKVLLGEYAPHGLSLEETFGLSRAYAEKLNDTPYFLVFMWNEVVDPSNLEIDGLDPHSFRVFVFEQNGSQTSESLELLGQAPMNYGLDSAMNYGLKPVNRRVTQLLEQDRINRTAMNPRDQLNMQQRQIIKLIRSMEAQARPVLSGPGCTEALEANQYYNLNI